jgi:6-phosphogluconolactonase
VAESATEEGHMNLLGRSHPIRAGVFGLASLSLVAATLFAASASAAVAKGARHHAAKAVGRVYTETNGSPANQVLIMKRYANGSLKRAGAVSTGGSGGHQPQPGCTPPGGCPFLDTQGELALTSDGHLLFAVNAGSNQITSFRATKSGLKRVSLISSDGVFPNSLTIHGNLLYVLNSNSDTIAGYHFSHNGKLTLITKSKQALVGGALPGLPRQIGFNTSGKVLMVTLLANAAGPPPIGGTAKTIDTFRVTNGVAGPAIANNSTTKFPFAFAFTGNHALVAQVNQLTGPPGSTATYRVSNSGAINPIDAGTSSGGNAPCWVEITKNGRYAYVVNTGGGAPGGATVRAYKVGAGGKLTALGNTAALPEFVKTDESLTRDDKYLYVLSPLESSPGSSSTPGPTSHIDVYKVHHNGTLSLVAAGSPIAAPGLTGLVAN